MNDNIKQIEEVIKHNYDVNRKMNINDIILVTAVALDRLGYRKQSDTVSELQERLLKRFGLSKRKNNETKHEKLIADYIVSCVNEVAASFGGEDNDGQR